MPRGAVAAARTPRSGGRGRGVRSAMRVPGPTRTCTPLVATCTTSSTRARPIRSRTSAASSTTPGPTSKHSDSSAPATRVGAVASCSDVRTAGIAAPTNVHRSKPVRSSVRSVRSSSGTRAISRRPSSGPTMTIASRTTASMRSAVEAGQYLPLRAHDVLREVDLGPRRTVDALEADRDPYEQLGVDLLVLDPGGARGHALVEQRPQETRAVGRELQEPD